MKLQGQLDEGRLAATARQSSELGGCSCSASGAGPGAIGVNRGCGDRTWVPASQAAFPDHLLKEAAEAGASAFAVKPLLKVRPPGDAHLACTLAVRGQAFTASTNPCAIIRIHADPAIGVAQDLGDLIVWLPTNRTGRAAAMTP
jgi:hypothetical protein